MFLIISLKDGIVTYQFVDIILRIKRDILKKPEQDHAKHEKNEVRDYVLQNGISYERENKQLLYVILTRLRKSMIICFHDLQSHTDVERTVSKLREFYFFPDMTQYVKQHVRSCLQCLMTKAKTDCKSGLLHPIPL